MLEHQLITKDFHYFTCNIHIPEGVALNKHIQLSPQIKLSDIKDVMIVIDGVCEMMIHSPQGIVDVLGYKDIAQDTLYHPFLSPKPTDDVFTNINEIRVEIITHRPLFDMVYDREIPKMYLYTTGLYQPDKPMDISFDDYTRICCSDLRDRTLYSVPKSIHTYIINEADKRIIIPRVKYIIGDQRQEHTVSSSLDLTKLEDWVDLVGERSIFKISISCDEYDPTQNSRHTFIGHQTRLIKTDRYGPAIIERSH